MEHYVGLDVLCQPACNPADDDGSNPSYRRVIAHGPSPLKARPTHLGCANLRRSISDNGAVHSLIGISNRASNFALRRQVYSRLTP
jgi:hypothetical protein